MSSTLSDPPTCSRRFRRRGPAACEDGPSCIRRYALFAINCFPVRASVKGAQQSRVIGRQSAVVPSLLDDGAESTRGLQLRETIKPGLAPSCVGAHTFSSIYRFHLQFSFLLK